MVSAADNHLILQSSETIWEAFRLSALGSPRGLLSLRVREFYLKVHHISDGFGEEAGKACLVARRLTRRWVFRPLKDTALGVASTVFPDLCPPAPALAARCIEPAGH